MGVLTSNTTYEQSKEITEDLKELAKLKFKSDFVDTKVKDLLKELEFAVNNMVSEAYRDMQ